MAAVLVSIPKLLQLVFVTFIDGEQYEMNIASEEAFIKVPTRFVYNCFLYDAPLPGVGMSQIHRLEDCVWWYRVQSTTGDVLGLRFADCGPTLTEEQTAFVKPFHDIVVGTDKTVDYAALLQMLAPNLIK